MGIMAACKVVFHLQNGTDITDVSTVEDVVDWRHGDEFWKVEGIVNEEGLKPVHLFWPNDVTFITFYETELTAAKRKRKT